LESSREFDLAIVGNGAIANALALHFSERHKDARVAIVGPSLRPGCASLAAGAMLNVFAELEAGALDYPIARAKFNAAVQAAKLWEEHLALLNSRLSATPPVRIRQGTYVVQNAVTDRLDDKNFEGIIGYLKEYKERFREVDPAEIEGIKPTPQARPLRAIFLEDEGAVSSRHLHRAYDEAFSRTENVRVFDTAVESLEPGGKVRTLKTKSGETITAKHVVIAAGAKTQDFVNQLGLEAKIPRIVLGVGCSLILKSATSVPKHVVRTPNRGLACGVYVVPYEENYCYVGATNYICPWEVPLPRVQAVHYLLQAAMEQVNTDFYKGEIYKTIVGYRPTTLDTYPLFGQTSVDGVWIASGTKRDGFHMSPKIAKELVASLESGKQPFDGVFKPERPLILEVPKQAAIDRAVLHIVSTGYQHGFRMPHSNWEPLIEDAVRRKVEDAYVRSGLAEYAYGIPAELLDMYRYGHADKNVETLLASRR
jgi:glycine/D-amino acid oxidase-like deaminating enzyme